MNVKLIMFRENGERREFPLREGKTTIGRQDDCDIRIPLAEISRHHAEVTVRNGVVMVSDQGSANGTIVNNRREKACELQPGDHLIIGPVVFTVQIDGKPKEIKPVRTRLTKGAGAVAAKAGKGGKDMAGSDLDPISALEALASSTDQTAIDPLPEED